MCKKKYICVKQRVKENVKKKTFYPDGMIKKYFIFFFNVVIITFLQ